MRLQYIHPLIYCYYSNINQYRSSSINMNFIINMNIMQSFSEFVSLRFYHVDARKHVGT